MSYIVVHLLLIILYIFIDLIVSTNFPHNFLFVTHTHILHDMKVGGLFMDITVPFLVVNYMKDTKTLQYTGPI